MKIARSRSELAVLWWFAPPIIMFAIHRMFGFSYATGGIQVGEVRPPDWQILYNLLMVVLTWIAPVAVVLHYRHIINKRS